MIDLTENLAGRGRPDKWLGMAVVLSETSVGRAAAGGQYRLA